MQASSSCSYRNCLGCAARKVRMTANNACVNRRVSFLPVDSTMLPAGCSSQCNYLSLAPLASDPTTGSNTAKATQDVLLAMSEVAQVGVSTWYVASAASTCANRA